MCRVWCAPDQTQTTTVMYGTEPRFLLQNATGVAKEWLTGYGWNHFATLQHLTPATRYYYRYHEAVVPAWP